ncbi:hypothetical protein Purlil1_10135 [Purpureocillium lilacinum]|uniref:Uncharacterized protein n=1 Tax=Purpureocillium lilacinum TaxID=33203 RepID=A0ABR0BPY9_PURLI|nr:hypothetical protein Purlil1_10135 [Purpureocillium lilacinum]
MGLGAARESRAAMQHTRYKPSSDNHPDGKTQLPNGFTDNAVSNDPAQLLGNYISTRENTGHLALYDYKQNSRSKISDRHATRGLQVINSRLLLRAEPRVVSQDKHEVVSAVCEFLVGTAPPAGAASAGAGSAKASVDGAKTLLGIAKNGQVLQGGAAARVILAAGGSGKEIVGVVMGAGAAGAVAGGIIGYLFTELTIKTACGLALGTTTVGYNSKSEAGRAIDAWRKTFAGEGMSTEAWKRLWTRIPLSGIVKGIAGGTIKPGINRKHPLMKLTQSNWECAKPQMIANGCSAART